MGVVNRRWILARRPEGKLRDSDFEQSVVELHDLGPGEVRVRVTHLSYDASQRLWASGDSYMPAVPLGTVMRGGGVGQVVESDRPEFRPGQLVSGGFGWQEYYQGDGDLPMRPLTPLPPGVTPEQLMGVMGLTSWTAWFGVNEILKPRPGDVALVSGAAGATGSVAGQLLKLAGARVIGIAGGSEKVRWVREAAGLDDCIDYKSEDLSERLAQLAPDGVNLVYENVGGAILDTAINHTALHARIALCGAVSGYDADAFPGLRNYMELVYRRVTLQGFLMTDYFPRVREAQEGIGALLAAGKLAFQVDMQEGFENIPATLRRLLEGGNQGKQMIRLTQPPLPIVP